MPGKHDGQRPFKIEIRFSGAPDALDAKRDAASVIEVLGGTVSKARTLNRRGGPVWELSITPTVQWAVTVRVPARACTESGAICIGGEALARSVEADVPGPEILPRVSIAAPAEPMVDEGATLEFTLTRTGSTARALTVNVTVTETQAMLDGTAPSTVTFAPGAASATLSLASVDDETLEDASAVKVTLTEGTGYAVNASARAADAVLTDNDIGALSARFVEQPAEHAGAGTRFSIAFEFVDYSPLTLGYRTVRDHLFTVTNGTITRAKRANRGNNGAWVLDIAPSGAEAVGIDARSTTDCIERHAICDDEERKFDGDLDTQIPGPAKLSVADARVEEAEGATLDFVVSLSRAATRAVSVDVRTSDGTALAGEDYEAYSDAVSFAIGEAEKTVSVTVKDDAHDEGSETMTLTLSNASGALIDDATATGTIENTDPMPQALAIRFGRTTATHLVDALGNRLERGPGNYASMGGMDLLRLGETRDGEESPRALAGSSEDETGGREPKAISGQEWLRGALESSTFHLSSRSDEDPHGPAFSAWGEIRTGGFEAEEDDVTLDGDVTTAIAGIDAEWDRVLAGAMFARSEGDGGYELDPAKGADSGSVESDLTGVFPYARLSINRRLDAWAMAGMSSGTLTLKRDNGRAMPTDISMRVGAIGVKGDVMDGASNASGLDLDINADAFWARTETEKSADLAASEGDTTRLRVALEGTRAFQVGAQSLLIPSAEIALRHDGGDAETGTGLELGASAAWTSGRLSAEGRVRKFVAHSDDGFEEWGASASLRFAPDANGRGLHLALTPMWGASESAASRLWGVQNASDLRGGGAGNRARIGLEAGYGLGAAGGTLSPYTGMTFGDDGRRLRAGARWTLRKELSIALEGAQSASGGTRDGQMRLEASLRF